MNKYIVILVALFLPVCVWGQVVVTGKIFSEMDGELMGAQVLEVDKSNRNVSAATADINGNFSLEVKNTANTLRFSFVGYKSVSLRIGDRKRFDVKLEEASELTEVVVTGKAMISAGTFPVPQREISGAVQRINTREFEGMSVASIDDALQGRIAGLDIVSNSGNLGSGSTLRIRGTSSINANSEPLIVVNDVPFENNLISSFDFASANSEQFANLLSINPDDIEDITVLKDGAAAAIWGSKGANGVISIRTKRGVKGPTRVQYNYRFSGKKQPAGLKMLNGDDYTMMMKQAYFNPYQREPNVREFDYDRTYSEYENFNENTDWVDAISQYGFTHDHNLTVSGGGDKARFRMSFGYYDESGLIIEQKLKRLTSRMSLDYEVSDKILFTSEFSITHTNNKKNLASDVSDGNNTDNLLSMAYRKMPNVSIYRQDQFGNNTSDYYTILPRSISDPTGVYDELHSSQSGLLNPVALARLAKNDDNQVKITPKLGLRYDILDPDVAMLRYRGFVQFDFDNQDISRFLPREVTTGDWSDDKVNRAYGKEAEALAIYSDQNITWVPQLGKDHVLTLYGSWQLSSVDSRNQEFERYGLPSSLITDAASLGSDKTTKTGSNQRRTMGFLTQLHYAIKERYILDASIRWDGDTRFGNNNRWGSFPAISGKWILSDEAFMDFSNHWLSELGVRAGFGIVGNTPADDYLYFSRYNGNWDYSGHYLGISAIKPTSVQLADLRWEKSTSQNIGMDIGILDRGFINLNAYKKRTEDLLIKDQPIPGSFGFSKLNYINAGTMDNIGWEFNLTTNRLISQKDFSLDFSLNLSNYINKVVEFSDAFLLSHNKEFNYKNGYESYLSRIQPGNAIGSIYGFRFKGVYQYDQYTEGMTGTAPVAKDPNGNVIMDNNGKPVPMYFAYGTNSAYQFRGGDAIYEDINHDGSIDELDIVYLGNSNPKVNGGFGSTIRYKNFTVNAFFNFRYGNKILNKARLEAEQMYDNKNQSIAVNWRWRKDGDLTDMPRALYQYGYNSLASDRYVEDGGFLRFKTLTFAYTFDPRVVNKWMLNQMSVFLTLNNLVTFTSYSGVDPEISQDIDLNKLLGVSVDENRTPRAQYFTLGVTVGF